MRNNKLRICKNCKKTFIYEKEKDIPDDIEYCSECRGDKYSKTANKIAKVLESMLK